MRVLGIETSCDETAAAVYDGSRAVLLSNALYSQVPIHAAYGGVVPEIASRTHDEKIREIVDIALREASLESNNLDGIAVTSTPGLPGSLLVGIGFAKALAYAWRRPLVGVNHLEGHILSPWIGEDPVFPHLCMVAAGGHTALYLVSNYMQYDLLGQTLDDAAGEAFDKVAKLFGFPYPGGPIIEKLAETVQFDDIYHLPRVKRMDYNMSFSGIKTAVMYGAMKRGWYNESTKRIREDMASLHAAHVASSLLVAIGDQLLDRVSKALCEYRPRAITFVGGVACNRYLRNRFVLMAEGANVLCKIPSPLICTDNAAMIAYAGWYRLRQGESAPYTLDIGETAPYAVAR